MSALFALLVEALQAGIFGLSHLLGGGLPGGIVAMTLLVRIGLLPVTVPLAVRARRRARALRALKPALDRIRKRWSDDPGEMAERTLALYRSRGLAPVDAGTALGAVVQAPVLLGFFRAVKGVLPALRGERFLWIGDLARPSPSLALLTAVLALAITTLAGATGGPQPAWTRWAPAGATLVALLFVSAGFGLYVLTSTAVSLVQAGAVRKLDRDA